MFAYLKISPAAALASRRKCKWCAATRPSCLWWPWQTAVLLKMIKIAESWRWRTPLPLATLPPLTCTCLPIMVELQLLDPSWRDGQEPWSSVIWGFVNLSRCASTWCICFDSWRVSPEDQVWRKNHVNSGHIPVWEFVYITSSLAVKASPKPVCRMIIVWSNHKIHTPFQTHLSFSGGLKKEKLGPLT